MNLFIPSASYTINNIIAGAVGYYGSFYDADGDQKALNTTTAYPVTIGSTYSANGVSIVSNTRITFAHTGVYTIAPSIQYVNEYTQEVDVDVWYTLNGALIADSNSRFGIPGSHGSENGHLIANMALTTPINAGQYVQLYWRTPNVLTYIHTYPPNTSPARPVVPGVILSVTSQSLVLTP